MKQTCDQFKMMMAETFQKLQTLSETKGAEYTGRRQDVNPHDNFDRHADRLGMLPEQVLSVYMFKHLDSIDTWIKDMASGNPRKLSESIDGRIDDAILYLLLLKGMYERRVNAGTPHDNWGNDSKPHNYETVREILNAQAGIHSAAFDMIQPAIKR